MCFVIWLINLSMAIPYFIKKATNDGSNKTLCFEGYQILNNNFIIIGMFFFCCFCPCSCVQCLYCSSFLSHSFHLFSTPPRNSGLLDTGGVADLRELGPRELTLVPMGLDCILDPVVCYFATEMFREFIRAHINELRKWGGSFPWTARARDRSLKREERTDQG